MTKLDIAKEVLRSLGIGSEKVLVKDAFAEPHRVISDPQEPGDREVELLTRTLIDHIREQVTKAATSEHLHR